MEEVIMKGRAIERVVTYKATDGRIFSYKDAKKNAEEHQKKLDDCRQRKIKLETRQDKFDVFARGLFGIKAEYNPDESSDEEELFCERIENEVPYLDVENRDFKDEISNFLFNLFTFIGPDKWSKIGKFLTTKVEKLSNE